MKSELEPQDIERIAEKVVEKLLPIIQVQQPDRLLNINELSDMLGKSKDQIYQWVNQSQYGLSDFPYMKAGRSLRFSEKDILQWMKRRGKPLEKR
jgi:predicted DNA-binding transcriptional regulator AlpA